MRNKFRALWSATVAGKLGLGCSWNGKRLSSAFPSTCHRARKVRVAARSREQLAAHAAAALVMVMEVDDGDDDAVRSWSHVRHSPHVTSPTAKPTMMGLTIDIRR